MTHWSSGQVSIHPTPDTTFEWDIPVWFGFSRMTHDLLIKPLSKIIFPSSQIKSSNYIYINEDMHGYIPVNSDVISSFVDNMYD